MNDNIENKMDIYANIDMERSGQKIKQLIKDAGYDVKTIQKYLRLSCPQPIYRWFHGKILPTVDHLFMLSKLLNVHMETFLVEKDDKNQYAFVFIKDYGDWSQIFYERITDKSFLYGRVVLYYQQMNNRQRICGYGK